VNLEWWKFDCLLHYVGEGLSVILRMLLCIWSISVYQVYFYILTYVLYYCGVLDYVLIIMREACFIGLNVMIEVVQVLYVFYHAATCIF